MNGQLFYAGVTRNRAPLVIRERIRIDRAGSRTLLDRLRASAAELMILGTCERFEIYAFGDRVGRPAWLRLLAGEYRLPEGTLRRHVGFLHGQAVDRHLLRVAAGLESRIIGEPHILGQVRTAFLDAADAGAIGAVLSALGRSAIHAGRRVRRETNLAGSASSWADLAVDRLEQDLGSLRARTILIVGTGQLARSLVSQVTERGATRVFVASRDASRARSLADQGGAAALTLSQLSRGVTETDGVVTCTAASSYLLHRAMIDDRRDKPLSVIDLSVPRNVDPAVARIVNVRLTHLEELRPSECTDTEAIASAERIVDIELDRFRRWQRTRRAVPAIIKLIRDAAASGRHSGRALHEQLMRAKAEAVA